MNPALYVPIMRVLPGDMEGARHASHNAQRFMRPLFVIVEPRPRESDPAGSFVVNAANLIVKSWRFKGTPFVELFDVPSEDDGDWFPREHPLILLHQYLKGLGVPFVPVTPIYREGDYLDAYLSVVGAGGIGMGVRIYTNDLEDPEETVEKVSALSRAADCPNSEADLIIDLERIRPGQLASLRSQVLDFLSATDLVKPYRSITLAGSSLPKNLDDIPMDEDRDVSRLDLTLWRDVRMARGASRLLGYGDHVAVRPEYEDRQSNFGNINAKLVYTMEEVTRIVRGHSSKNEKLEFQYPKLARRLISSGVLRENGFSWGDDRIAACAANRWVSGKPVTWISVATSHHFELVPAQVARELGMVS